jgi:hypothetical protein
MNRRAFVVTAAAASLAGCLPSTPSPQPTPAPPKLPFWPNQTTAFSVQATFYDPNAGVSGALEALGFKNWRGGYPMAALQIPNGWHWARSDAWWKSIPPGTRPLLITSPFTDVSNPSNELLASYHAAFAARYPGCDYELDNEPDLRQNWTAIFIGANESWTVDDALAAYVAKSKLVAAAIRGADPTARIVSGGTSGVNLDWIGGLIERGMFGGVADACGIHPYGCDPSTVADAYAPVVAALPTGTMIWSTEWGNGDTTLVTPMFDAHVAMGVPFFNWYRLDDQPNAPSGGTWGLVSATYVPKQPAYDDAKAINATL